MPEVILPDTIVKGDCLEVMRNVPDGSVDLILCDLPYGTTGCFWDNVIPLDELWEQYGRILKDDGTVVLFGNQPFTSNLICSNIKWYKYNWVWMKSTRTGHMNAKMRPLKQTEDICVFAPKRPRYNPQDLIDAGSKDVEAIRAEMLRKRESDSYKGRYHGKSRSIELNEGRKAHMGKEIGKTVSLDTKGNTLNKGDDGTRKAKTYIQQWTNYPTNVLSFKNEPTKKVIHPMQKPVKLLEYLIRTYTSKGDTVMDNTMGAGSTGVAAVDTGRRFVGIEMEGRYFDASVKRIEEAEREYVDEEEYVGGENGENIRKSNRTDENEKE